MSSDEIAIRVQGLSKCYQIYDRPQDRLKQFILPRVRPLLGKSPRNYFREFWALRDVSFEVKKGEVVGIIGRNGSGKSTLLQMICGTLNPTSGSIQTQGRIAALLELGSGFNPEFTGRENVYMNAAVLGLSKEETDARFDEIAAFADIGDFIEQPVKTYSSGMIVRLAFGVIAHVDADVLVVDEALAVGDAVFTQKCMRFIRSFREQGTLLFVSHDMSAVQNLCQTAIWLHQGQVRQRGTSKGVGEAYLQYTLQEVYGSAEKLISVGQDVPKDALSAQPEHADETEKVETVDAPILEYGARFSVRDNLAQAKGWTTGAAEILSVQLERQDGKDAASFEGGERVCLRIRAKAHQFLASPILGFLVRDRLGQDLFGENSLPFSSASLTPVNAGQEFEAKFVFRLPMLPNGDYAITAAVADGTLHANVEHHWLHDAVIIHVSSSKVRWGLVGVAFESVSLIGCEEGK
ncbi:ABC transporter ATP-binding protein [Hylemonella gracilis str. Niagara R]|uniref:ABC transporter ATP-binding protein n=1 Tax=Hylemonella gracilis str. Niagara R TaxID=1458275 RepID=A0A016XEJ9_9BURK|nr:ABC transporter ATP-binding protein [Hylemonella gracilis]EYC50345.1 ABC transporter ATP-binding protein [Hylemonella gracilis str. Niagara R]